MADVELTRSRDDRRLYVLEGIGSLRLQGWAARAATAEENGRSWQITRRGFWRRAVQASDEAGAAVGEFQPRALGRGGNLRWAARDLALRPASIWRQRYALADGDRELAILDGKGWGRQPVKITVNDAGQVEPGLLLFAAFIIRGLAVDAASADGAGGAAALG